MPSKSVQISGFVFLASLALLAGCSKEAKDDVMGDHHGLPAERAQRHGNIEHCRREEAFRARRLC